MNRWIVAVLLAVFVVPALRASSLAATFNLVGVQDPNLVAIVDFTYTYDSTEDVGIIDITIMNDTSLAGGPDPRLTAFAFNLPEGATVDLSTVPQMEGWHYVVKPNGIDTPGRFGFYDVAAITGPNFNGGKPNSGIPPGETFVFQFILTGPNLAALTEENFLDLASYSRPRPAESVQYFIGRFQRTGIDGEGSDVAIPGELSDPEAPV
jgi:uncharacterized cupredoxin-like copper-binding protein